MLFRSEQEGEEELRYAERVDASLMSDEARDKAKREIARLSRMSPISPEAAVVRSYLDWLLDMPWGIRTEENENIARAEKILDRDHYGMRKVKDRVLEFLAVRRRAGTDIHPLNIALLCHSYRYPSYLFQLPQSTPLKQVALR